ncbi:MAG: hypothetical protein HYW48_09890 [Deltaproteobacteria bacterium]|nr:hypothetical protein [Deltaproteobacteria bacterium]
MDVKFESDFQKKILAVSFPKMTVLGNVSDVESWRKLWMEQLKAWHSPYKAIIDCSHLRIASDSEVQKALERMFNFLARFFLKKVVGWGNGKGLEHLPFEVLAEEEEALAALGLREKQPRKASEDFRSLIHLDNHFEQKVVELSFAEPVALDKGRLVVLKSKLTNNLMQWHSHWNLLIDCTNLEIPPELNEPFQAMIRFFKGFFLSEMVGYHPQGKGKSYPFPTFRARHRAAAHLKSDTLESGRDANCAERKEHEIYKAPKGH